MNSDDLLQQLAHILIGDDELTEIPRFDVSVALVTLAMATAGVTVSALAAFAQSHGMTLGGQFEILNTIGFIFLFIILAAMASVFILSRWTRFQSRRHNDERRLSLQLADEMIRAWGKIGNIPLLLEERIRRLAAENGVLLNGLKLRRVKLLFATCRIQREIFQGSPSG